MRGLSNDMQAAVESGEVRPVFLVKMEFDSGEAIEELHVWTGNGNLTYSGDTYTGLGDLLSISEIQESSEIQATGITVSLTGAKTSLVTLAKNQDYQGRPLTLYFGAFDAAGDLIADPMVAFSGLMDVMSITEAGEYSTINIAVESRLIALEQTRIRRYTDQDQKIDHPTDKGFEFVTSIVEKEILWGRPTPASIGHTSGTRNGSNPNLDNL